ncbi:MAG: desulfoferrodoxin [Candidatus Electrothrix sp. AUS4]|nr:desulfoferrodoxin [Candidatus Electrothrix sp. AUS4]
MTKKNEVYKCPLCGNIVQVLHTGAGELVCCGQPMEVMAENTVDAAQEKHIPVLEKTDSGYKVTVGSVAHPMEAKHWIEWIELVTDSGVYRADLNPGDAPEAVFSTVAEAVTARAYCNLHGLWKS